MAPVTYLASYIASSGWRRAANRGGVGGGWPSLLFDTWTGGRIRGWCWCCCAFDGEMLLAPLLLLRENATRWCGIVRDDAVAA